MIYIFFFASHLFLIYCGQPGMSSCPHRVPIAVLWAQFDPQAVFHDVHHIINIIHTGFGCFEVTIEFEGANIT